MRSKISFVKMQGLGNDFVIIDEKQISNSIDRCAFAKSISERVLGIGCDQFIIYDKKSDKVKMEIYNQDGSKAKACGNASRCLMKLIYDSSGEKNITLDIDGRDVTCQYINENNMQVNMGAPLFEKDWMPDSADLWTLAERYMIEPKEMLCVDVANPHLVIFSKLSEKDMAILGHNLQNSDLFPDGVNVNFAKITDKGISLKVWERGAGFTYSCGSGAIATFAAADKLGFAEDKAEIIFQLGSLKMQKQNNNIFMTGAASYVFSGEYIYGK